jgi:hypothetical protein
MGRRIRLAAVGIVVIAGCKDPSCTTQSTKYATTVSTVGYTGPTTGLPVARFDVMQNYVSHTPYEACVTGPLQDVGTIDLTITSIAAWPVSFAYELQGVNADGNPMWFFRDSVARLAPGQTLSVGRVATSPVPVDLGARVIFTFVAQVP